MSAAFIVIVPFYGAVFWATVLAVLFLPAYRRALRSMRQRRTIAALATVLLIVLIVILPLTAAVVALFVQEASSVYARIQSGALSPGRYFEQTLEALSTWAVNLLHRFQRRWSWRPGMVYGTMPSVACRDGGGRGSCF